MTPTSVSQLPVLLVDDEPALLRSASLLLRAAGIAPILTLDDSRLVLSRVADDTDPPLMTLETVARDTPLRAASSSSVPATDPPVPVMEALSPFSSPGDVSNPSVGRHGGGTASGG